MIYILSRQPVHWTGHKGLIFLMTTDNLTTTVNIHRFSLIFTHFHSFSHVVNTCFSLIFHMLSTLIFHQFSSIFINFHSFCCYVVKLSCVTLFLELCPAHGPPLGHFPETHDNRKFSINPLSRRLKLHLPPSFMRAESMRSMRKAQCVCVYK